jgi:hypothetical protein
MKTFHFICLALLLSISMLSCSKLGEEAQVNAETRTTVASTDNQWYVKGGCGISGYDLNNKALYNNCGINSLVTINNETHPTQTNERRDVFAIFNNGTYINTRGNQTLFQGNGTSGYKVTFNASSPVKYMYMTAPYNPSDPILLINVNGNTSNLYAVGLADYQTSPAILSANQDCVNNDDITIIINTALFSNNSYSLQFNDTYLSPSTVFNGSYSFHNVGTYTSGSGVITNLNRNTAYQFINFKVHNITEEVLNTQLQFTLKAGNTTIATLSETVRATPHDPNVLALENKKQLAEGFEYNFRLECFNDSKYGGVKQVSFSIADLPNQSGIQITDWAQGGETAATHSDKKALMTRTGGTSAISIDRGNRLCNATSEHYTYEDQKAWIRFKVTTDHEITGDFMQLLKPKVIFDGIAFKIKDYEDCTQIVN